jgi:RNA polymerase sigma-70 factor (ECF subfamily)
MEPNGTAASAGEARDPSEPLPFSEILEAARAGSAESAGRLIDRARPYLLHLAARALHGRAAAGESPSDVVQEAAIVAVRRLSEFEGNEERRFRAWMSRIVTLRVRNVLRRGQIREAVGFSTAGGPADGGSSPSSRAGHDEERNRLEHALKQLTEPDCQLMRWHLEDNLTFVEMGRRLGVSDVTARANYLRAIKRLRSVLNPPEPPAEAAG